MNRSRSGFSLAAVAAVILLLLQVVPAALAQDQNPQDQNNEQDPPTRAGRLGYVQGSVSFQPGGQGDWLEAVANRPLTTGDNLWADKDSRAEVQIGSTSIRLGAETSVTFLDLGDNVTQLRLSVGSLFFRVRHLNGGETFEVDTPNLAFNVDQPGEYRVDVNENGDQTTAVVWHGDAEVTGAGNSYRLGEGQQGTFSGTDQLAYQVGAIGPSDDFDQWCLSRDQREDSLPSRQYVSDEMTGYEDLDQYGQWRNVPQYGNVWTPAGVPVGWAPYRFGHWAYVWPWGWTWVEDEPWGFAPFHYGRWAFVGGGWGWVPGPVAVAPVYSPALVAFIGGGGLAVGVGAGVGWFPLGPGEVFVPWYRTSPRYVQNINITNTQVTVVQVTNVYHNVTVNHAANITYVNQRVNNSVTVVNHDTFVNARSVNNNLVRVDQRQIANARVTPAVVTSFEPQRQSVMGAARPVRVAPPAQALSRPVVATRQPVLTRGGAPQVAGLSRSAPPPLRTVRAAPPGEAKPLERGARGGPQGGNAPMSAGRPGMPENSNVPRSGLAAEPRPGASESNSSGVRPNAPGDNMPNRNVPRPPSAEYGRPPAQEDHTSSPPENRHQMTPPPENRQQSAPASRPQTGSEPAPRPEAKPAQAPPQHETKPAPREKKSNPPDKDKDKDKDKEKEKEPGKSK
jgi:FecR protein